MGTHPNGPSMLKGLEAPSLADHIAKDPKMLGEESRKVFGDQLPFLFKVLSVQKALSIQVRLTAQAQAAEWKFHHFSITQILRDRKEAPNF